MKTKFKDRANPLDPMSQEKRTRFDPMSHEKRTRQDRDLFTDSMNIGSKEMSREETKVASAKPKDHLMTRLVAG